MNATAGQLDFDSLAQKLHPQLPRQRALISEPPGRAYMDERAARRASRRPPACASAVGEAAWRGLEAGGLVSFRDFLRFREWARHKMLTCAEVEEAIDHLIEKRWEQRVAKRREQLARRQASRDGRGGEAVVTLLFGPEAG